MARVTAPVGSIRLYATEITSAQTMNITTIDLQPLGARHQRLWRGARFLYMLIPIPVFMVYLVQTGIPFVDHIVFFLGPVVLLAAFGTALFVSGRFVARWGTIAGIVFSLFVTINIVVVCDKFIPSLLDGSLFELGVLGINFVYLTSLVLVGIAARAGLSLGKAIVPSLGARFGDVLALAGKPGGRSTFPAAPLAFRRTPSGWLAIASGATLYAAAFWLFVLDHAVPGVGLGDTLPPDLYFPASIAGFALLTLLGTLLLRRGLRWIRLDARGQMRADTRPPVLLLRSFKDDQARLRPIGFLSLLQLRRSRLEEAVGREVGILGPFIAVGTPGESLPELGAHRAYLGDGEWQHAVLDWIDRSRIVLMIAGTTPWVAWELRALRDAAALTKLLLLLPPGRIEDRDARLRLARDCLGGSPWAAALAHADLSRAIAVRFRPGGGIVVLEGAQGTERDCRLAVRVGLFEMLTGPRPTLGLTDATYEPARVRSPEPAHVGRD